MGSPVATVLKREAQMGWGPPRGRRSGVGVSEAQISAMHACSRGNSGRRRMHARNSSEQEDSCEIKMEGASFRKLDRLSRSERCQLSAPNQMCMHRDADNVSAWRQNTGVRPDIRAADTHCEMHEAQHTIATPPIYTHPRHAQMNASGSKGKHGSDWGAFAPYAVHSRQMTTVSRGEGVWNDEFLAPVELPELLPAAQQGSLAEWRSRGNGSKQNRNWGTQHGTTSSWWWTWQPRLVGHCIV